MCSCVRSSTPSSEVEHGLLSLAVFKSALSMMLLIFPVSQSPERSESSCTMTPTDSKLELADIPAETLTSRNFISGILKPINQMSITDRQEIFDPADFKNQEQKGEQVRHQHTHPPMTLPAYRHG